MEELLGNQIAVYFGLGVVIFGGAGFMMGQAVANTWRPLWQLLPYGFLLSLFERFLAWSLFDADALSISGYLIDLATIMALSYLGFRLTKVNKMVTQYPWIYERAGPFAWRERR